MTEKLELEKIFELLYAAYGPQHWWPAKTAFEVCVGAILAQNTAWTNVEKAIARLRRAGLLGAEALRAAPEEALAEAVRPAGTWKLKAAYLRGFVDHLQERHGGKLGKMLGRPRDVLREELLGIRGIGPETADCIVLYAAGHPSFVVDAYTRRILERHYLLNGRERYEDVRELFHRNLPAEAARFNEFHALFVRLGKERCRKRPLCEGCPLEALPHRE